MENLTLIIPTFNNGLELQRKIPYLQKFFTHIVILDSFSTDATTEFCEKFGVRLIQREYDYSARQKNWSLDHISTEWVLFLDSDEEISQAMLEELQAIDFRKSQEFVTGSFPRVNCLYGERLGKGVNWPDRQKRLFMPKETRYSDQEVHSQVLETERVKFFLGEIIHDDFKSIDIWYKRNLRYIRYECERLQREDITWSWKRQYLYPLYVFFKTYIQNKGWRHGYNGYFIAMQWFIYHTLVFARLREIEKRN